MPSPLARPPQVRLALLFGQMQKSAMTQIGRLTSGSICPPLKVAAQVAHWLKTVIRSDFMSDVSLRLKSQLKVAEISN
jgi:hypothetical protein